jgi:GTP-binding protein
MVSMAAGKALGFSLVQLARSRRALYNARHRVYEGQVIGNTSKGEEMFVNPTKGKQLTNMRASGTDEGSLLVPPYDHTLTIERGLEVMNEDEYLEITPQSVRLRKKAYDHKDRSCLHHSIELLKFSSSHRDCSQP